MSSFNFAAASYSNSAPLVDYLSTASPSSKIKYGYPSSHLRELIIGNVDCALIPVVHAFNNPIIKPLLNVGVASDGEVKSVLINQQWLSFLEEFLSLYDGAFKFNYWLLDTQNLYFY